MYRDIRSRRNRVFEPIFNFQPPKWLPVPTSIRRRQERRNRWPPFNDDLNVDILKVLKVDLLLQENGILHHTDKYNLMNTKEDKPKLVIRRGQEFVLKITFNRAFNIDSDGISFVFSVHDGKPSMSHGTLVVVPLLTKTNSLFDKKPVWSAYIEDIDENSMKFQFKTSTSCSIGKWKIAIDTKKRENEQAISYSLEDPVYVIFNPWNKDDDVYMDVDDLRQEYVLEDSGLIWRGTHDRIRPSPWAYSQFEKDVLDCALYILSGLGNLSSPARADPVKCVREISAAVNSPDDDGVLVGNWTDNYDGGIPPTKWTGSLKILRKYYSTKKSVKFGQCWVFAGVVTSICRAIGIPCRPVTNYVSAHDTHGSLTMDYFFDDDGKAIDALNTDKVWSFHVWNEVWMQRPDLGTLGVDNMGWQVIDATPQERSDGMFQCGPASVAAIHRGEVNHNFDGKFVFGEINADKVYWHYRGVNRPLKLLGKKPEGIGMFISTKAVGKFEREDLTDNYKYPEKSSEERESMVRALKLSESQFSRYYLNEEFNDVRFDFELRDDIVIGSPFSVTLIIENVHEDKEYETTASLRVETMLYTGKVKNLVKKDVFNLKIAPKSVEELTLNITYEDYASKLCDQCAFNVTCFANVDETDFEYFAQDDFRIRKPDIKFKIDNKDEERIVGVPLTGTISLKNPLPVVLTKCQFNIESPGMGEPIKINLKEKIEVGGIATANFELLPSTDGEKTISAKFTSRELEDVDGFTTVAINISNEVN